MKRAIVVIALLISGTNHAQDAGKATPEERAASWHEGMRLSIPKAFCALKAYRTCFQVSEDACIVAAQSAADRCAPELAKRYPVLASPETASKAGAQYAACVSYTHSKLSGADLEQVSACLAKSL